jgi:hypothetical protein
VFGLLCRKLPPLLIRSNSSQPKFNNRETGISMEHGTGKWLVDAKGYGFISRHW